jgi:nitroreductase
MHQTPPPAVATLFLERGPEWLAAVASRHSRRAYDMRPLDTATLDAIDEVCTNFRPYPDARVVLVRTPAVDVFTGLVGGYGKVKGTPHLLAFIGDERAEFVDQHLGFTGEAIVLEASARGVDTCWVAGFFKPSLAAQLVEMAPGERIFAVSPLGHGTAALGFAEKGMRSMSRAHRRRSVEQIAPSISAGWPDWAVAAIETARLAPSAVNRQPWRFRIDAGALVVAQDSTVETPKVTKRLDCGIAMLHAELGARATGADGAWRDLAQALDVARYVTTRTSE